MERAANFDFRETKDQIAFGIFALEQELAVVDAAAPRRRHHVHQLGRQIVTRQNQMLVIVGAFRRRRHRLRLRPMPLPLLPPFPPPPPPFAILTHHGWKLYEIEAFVL